MENLDMATDPSLGMLVVWASASETCCLRELPISNFLRTFLNESRATLTATPLVLYSHLVQHHRRRKVETIEVL